MSKARGGSLAGGVLFVAVVSASLAGCATKPAATPVEVEIEPIPLDSDDPRYSSYLAEVRGMIKEKWRHPCAGDRSGRRCEHLSAKPVILFDILKDGQAARFVVVRSSGHEIYDQYAVNAIGRASPFPPPPPELMAAPANMRIRIVAALDYDSFSEQSETQVLSMPGGATGTESLPGGTAGIEGGPIPLDSTDGKFNDYLARVRQIIKKHWHYPCIKNLATGGCDYKSARLVIEFGILKDGRVPWVVVRQTSGYQIYDDEAATAIRQGAPFPPVPPALMAMAAPGSSGVSILAAFQYVLFPSPEGGK